MPMETKNLLIYITIAVILILIGIAVFATQTKDMWLGFMKSLEQPEEPSDSTRTTNIPIYLSPGESFVDNLKTLLTKFDPQSKFVYCDMTANYNDGDENDIYVILCDPIIFDISGSQKDLADYDYLYTNVFSEVITDTWIPQTFGEYVVDSQTTKQYSIAVGGPTYIEISPDTLNYEGGCWGSSVDATVFGSGKKKIFVEQDQSDIVVKVPSESKIVVRIAFNVSEPDMSFNPAVAICPNIIR